MSQWERCALGAALVLLPQLNGVKEHSGTAFWGHAVCLVIVCMVIYLLNYNITLYIYNVYNMLKALHLYLY